MLPDSPPEKISLELKVLDSVLAGYWDWDIVSNYEYLSPGFKRMFGYADGELPNSPESWQQLIFPEDLPKMLDCFEQHVCSHGVVPFTSEVRYRHRDGSTVWIICSGQVIEWSEAEQPLRVIGCHINITQRKQAEIALVESEAKYRHMVEAAKDVIWLTDAAGCFIYLSPQFTTLFGWSEQEWLGKTSFELVHPDDCSMVSADFQRIIKLGVSTMGCEFRHLHQDGSYKWVITSVTPLKNAAGELTSMQGILRDISERKQSEEAIQQQLVAIESTIDGVAILQESKFLYVNQSHLQLFGYTDAAELIGRGWQVLYAPEVLQHIEQEILPMVARDRAWQGEVVATRRDGSTFYEELSLTMMDNGIQVCVCRDISARKQSEETIRVTTAQLEIANRELEAFTYSVSHDLRAPLRAIDGFSRALLEDYGTQLDAEGQEYFGFIRSNVQRMGMLIDDLLCLSRLTRLEMQLSAVNLSEFVREISQRLQSSEPQRSVDWVIVPDAVVIGDANLLRIVLENFLENAWKFTSHHPTAQIEFGQLADAGQPSPDQMVFFIRDNGAGFNMAYATMLFQVFQRLHNADEFPGMGIGLATVQRILHRHGGQVWATGAVEQGATFYFSLPSKAI